MLEAEKFPWLDKGLNGADLQEPINPDDFFETDGCRPFENWAVLENTIGGLIDEETKTTDFASLQMKVLLTDDAVGIVKADSSAFLLFVLQVHRPFPVRKFGRIHILQKAKDPLRNMPKVSWMARVQH